jgi:hypothetical protein
MPNKPPRNKARTSHFRQKTRGRSRAGSSVKGLLAGGRSPVFTRISAQKSAADAWRTWLETRLPTELSSRISGIVERDGGLTVFTESAAWSARLRFALAEIEKDVREKNPDLTGVLVRVLPRSAT